MSEDIDVHLVDVARFDVGRVLCEIARRHPIETIKAIVTAMHEAMRKEGDKA